MPGLCVLTFLISSPYCLVFPILNDEEENSKKQPKTKPKKNPKKEKNGVLLFSSDVSHLWYSYDSNECGFGLFPSSRRETQNLKIIKDHPSPHRNTSPPQFEKASPASTSDSMSTSCHCFWLRKEAEPWTEGGVICFLLFFEENPTLRPTAVKLRS